MVLSCVGVGVRLLSIDLAKRKRPFGLLLMCAIFAFVTVIQEGPSALIENRGPATDVMCVSS